MKILVIEDKEMHQQSARETLVGHDVTIVESFDKAMELMCEWNTFPYEVVLTDMMMPMSEKTLVSEAFNPSEQVPYGFVIALKAALRGAKFVAMVTDTNHHMGAMSAAIDHFGCGTYYTNGCKPNFVINGAKVVFVHAPFVEDAGGPCKSCNGTLVCKICHGTGTRLPGPWLGVGDSCEPACFCTSNKVPGKNIVEVRKDWEKVLADLTA